MCIFRKFDLLVLAIVLLAIPFSLTLSYSENSLLQGLKAEDDSAISFDKEIIIFDQGIEYKLNFHLTRENEDRKTIREILEIADIKIQENDIIFPSLDSKIREDDSPLKIIIFRAIPVFLNIYGKERKIFTQKGKVKEVLEENEIDFKKDDLINHDFNGRIFPGIKIKIWKKAMIPKKGKSSLKNTGLASWYGPGFYGKRTACGEIFTGDDLTAAHRTFPCGTKVKVTNLNNGKSIIVRINDRGPYGKSIIDLSLKSKKAIGMGSNALVRLEIVK